jgi:hypothetical protein
VAESFRSGGQHAQLAARLKALPRSEYAFLLGRFIDSATLARAEAIAAASGVHPHEVLIAHGWLDAADYYRALAENCGAPSRPIFSPPTSHPRRRQTRARAWPSGC